MSFDRSDASRLLRFSAQATSLLSFIFLAGVAVSVGLLRVSDNLGVGMSCAAFVFGIFAERELMLRRLRVNYPEVIARGAANAMALGSVPSLAAPILLGELLAGFAGQTLAPVAAFAGFFAFVIASNFLAAAFGLWITRRTEAIGQANPGALV